MIAPLFFAARLFYRGTPFFKSLLHQQFLGGTTFFIYLAAKKKDSL